LNGFVEARHVDPKSLKVETRIILPSHIAYEEQRSMVGSHCRKCLEIDGRVKPTSPLKPRALNAGPIKITTSCKVQSFLLNIMKK
jgi:hypothetical protein